MPGQLKLEHEDFDASQSRTDGTNIVSQERMVYEEYSQLARLE